MSNQTTRRDASVIITADSLFLYRESVAVDKVPFAFYAPMETDEYGTLIFPQATGVNLACDMIRNGFVVGIIRS